MFYQSFNFVIVVCTQFNKFTKVLSLVLFSFFVSIVNAQVGINTTTPEGVLDIVSVDQGVVVPRVSAIENVTTPEGNLAVDGTMVYDLSRSQMCMRIAGSWVCTDVNGTNTTIPDPIIPLSAISSYIKASNTDADDFFGGFISLTTDGTRMAVTSIFENSNATGINGDQTNNLFLGSGAVYIFLRSGSVWTQEAYIKASNTGSNDLFGSSVSISGDGGRLAVGARSEDSNATGINGDETNNGAADSGAAYMFQRSGTTWTQEAYIKASNTNAGDEFGYVVDLSTDGTQLAVGAHQEDSSTAGINGNETNNGATNSGAAYAFLYNGTSWVQEAYIKASNPEMDDNYGSSLSLSGDGNRLVVGSGNEDSNATGINGDETDNTALDAGAAYIYLRSGGVWTQEAYIKASNTEGGDFFARSLSFTEDGGLLAVGAINEDSNATGIDGDQTDNSLLNPGAVYIYVRSGATWTQEAYIKASNTDTFDIFGSSISFSADGTTLIVGAGLEDSSTTGINGDQTDDSAINSGATYIFQRSGGVWSQESYIKASNTEAGDSFGRVSLSGDGLVLAIGASQEDSNATGIDGDQTDNSALRAGAVYIIN